MHIMANIYRCKSSNGKDRDCTNGGISAKHDRVVVTDLPIDKAPAEIDGMPTLCIVANGLGDGVCAVPPLCVRPPNKTHAGPMAGGNYVSTSDSRFSEIVGKVLASLALRPRFYGAVSVHDRFDTWADHEALSR